MKKILYIFIAIIFSYSPINANEVKCDTALSKLKPKCNLIGKGMDKMRKFSKENKTLDQSVGNITEAVKEKLKKK
tara:strand:+ start:464 stop:688 length:225 start_codon:yes stop_codon:yes gene_type:complete